MASLLQLRGRIKAAQNVSKTTKAMQMIAASKLKRAQTAALSGRPYVEKLDRLTKNIAQKAQLETPHPYMQEKFDTGKTLLLFITPDKGLCGGLITNLLREFLKNRTTDNNFYVLIGKKAELQVAKFESEIIASFHFGTTLPSFDMVYPLAHIIDEYFLGGKVDTVKIIGSHFTNVFSQTPRITTLLPITLKTEEEKNQHEFYLFEPTPQALLPSLLKHYMEMSLYQHLLESFVSEQAARMIAMQNATDNARDIIEDLRLDFNKTRQARITSELLDLVGTRTGIKE